MAPTMSIVQSLYLQVSIFKTGKEDGAYLQLLIQWHLSKTFT
jgi:hypothetical protein